MESSQWGCIARVVTVACAGALMGSGDIAPDAVAAKAKEGQATLLLTRTGVQPPREHAAKSPLHHPGFDVSVPGGGVYVHRHLFDLEGGRHRLPVSLRRISEREVSYDGPFGRNWWLSLQSFLRVGESGAVTLFDTDGREDLFPADGDGYTTPPGLAARLTALRAGSKIKGWTLQFPDGSSRFYDSKGRWKTWLRPDGQTVKLASGTDFRLKKVQTPEKRKLAFKYGKDRRLASVTLPGKQVFTFTYDARGNLAAIARPRRTGDETPARWEYAYDAQDRLTQVKNSAGGVVGNVAYHGDGRVSSITDFAGKAALFEWDGSVLEGVNRDGNTMDVTADANGQVLSRSVSGLGEGTETETSEYDSLLRRTAQNRPAGDRMEWKYPTGDDPLERGNVLEHRHISANSLPAGAVALEDLVTTRTYLPGGDRVLSEVRPDGARYDFTYDDSGLLESIFGPAVLTPTGTVRPLTSYEYDAFGRRTAVVHPGGSRDVYAYAKKPRDLVVEVVRDAGSGSGFVNERVRYQYDASGRLAATLYDDGSKREQVADAWGAVVSVTDENGRETMITYDRAGNPMRTVTPMLDADGDPVGDGTQMLETTTDALDRVVQERRFDGMGNVSTVAYAFDNGLALPTTVTFPLGKVTTVEYDARGRRTRVFTEDGDGPDREEAFSYDRFGNVATRSNGVDGVTTYQADGFGRPEAVYDPVGGTTHYGRDAAGRTLSVTESDDQGNQYSRTRYAYDAAGHMIRVERDRFDPGPGSPVGVTEVVETRRNVRGLPALETDACGGTVAYTYDGAGRVISREEQPLDRERTYTYDSRGRLATRTERRGSTSRTTVLSLDPAGNLVGAESPEGEVALRRDSLGRVVGVIDALGRTRNSVVDAQHRILSTTQADPSGGASLVRLWTWNGEDRLTGFTGPDGAPRAYIYDFHGRLGSETRNGATVVQYAYDGAGRIASRTDAGGTVVTFEYDARGRVVGRTASTGESQSFSWDRHHRLREGVDSPLSGSPVTVERSHDSLGNRRTETQPGGTVTRTFEEGGGVRSMTTPDGLEYEYDRDPAGRVLSMSRGGDDYLSFSYAPGLRRPVSRIHDAMTSTFTLDYRERVTAALHEVAGNEAVEARFDATYDARGRRLTQVRETGFGERWEYDSGGRLVRHFMESDAPASGAPSTFTMRTDFAWAAGTGRPASMTFTDAASPSVAGASTTHPIGYDGAGRMTTGLGSSLSLDSAGRAATWIENRPAYDAGARNLVWDAFGRLVEVRRASNNSLLGAFTYDVFGRPVHAREEQFTGIGILTRYRVFDGCRLVSELSPLPLNPSDGYDLFYVPDPTGRGHLASGFKDTFNAEYLWQTDTRDRPGHIVNVANDLRNESYRLFSALGLPHFTTNGGANFRGAPSLNTATAPPGLAASHSTGLQFAWGQPLRDPFLPRPLDPHPWGPEGRVPFPGPPGPTPGPGGGDVGDPEEPDWEEVVNPEDAVEDTRCEDAESALAAILAKLQAVKDAARRCGEDLDRVNHKRASHEAKLKDVESALDEILDAQNDLRTALDYIASADLALNSLDVLAGAVQEGLGLKGSAQNFGTMSKSTGKLFGGATGKAADKAVGEFAEAFSAEALDLVSGNLEGAAMDVLNGALEDAGVLNDAGGFSTVGAYDALASLLGKSTTGDLIDSLARNFQTGIESRAALKDALSLLDRIERDRLSFKEYLKAGAAGLCAEANQALDALKDGWGEATAAPLAAELAAMKAAIEAATTR